MFNPNNINSREDIPSNYKIWYRKPETIHKMFNTVAKNFNNGFHTVDFSKLLSFNIPYLFSIVGENTDIICQYDTSISVKSFLFFRYLDFSVFLIQLPDGRVFDAKDYPFDSSNIKTSTMLNSFSRSYSSISAYKSLVKLKDSNNIMNKRANNITNIIINNLTMSTFRPAFSKFLKTLNADAVKLMYRTRTYNNYFYNNLVDKTHGLFRRQFATSFPTSSILLTQENSLKEIDLGKSGFDIIKKSLYKNYNDISIKYIMGKTPHSFLKTKAKDAIQLISSIDKNFWPKKKTEWPYLNMLSKHYNKFIFNTESCQKSEILNTLAKKYRVGKYGWNVFNKFGTPEELETTLNDCYNDIVKSPFLTGLMAIDSNIKNITDPLYQNLKDIFVRMDIQSIFNLNKFFHNTLDRAMSEADLIIQEKSKEYKSNDVTRIELSEEFLSKIKNDLGVTITQLLSENDFLNEGSFMRHCVRSYYASSIKGKNPIFSLKINDSMRSTIEFSVKENNIISKEKLNNPKKYQNKSIFDVSISQNRSFDNKEACPALINAGIMLCDYLGLSKNEVQHSKAIEEGKSKIEYNYNYKLKNALVGSCIVNRILNPFFNKDSKEIIDANLIFSSIKN